MWEFLKAGGPFMFLLVICSIVGLTFVIERGLALRRAKVLPPELKDELARVKPDLKRVGDLAAIATSPLARLVQHAQAHRTLSKDENAASLQTQARQEVAKLERGLVILEIVVGIGPLLGLVGTVHGLITLFGDLGKAGLADNAVLAKGISIALNTTLMGLLVAIPALVAWSYYNKKVENLALEMEAACDKLLREQYRS